MESFGNVCDVIFSVSVLAYIIFTSKYVKLLKEQNKQLAELLDRTREAANVMKNFRNGNEHPEEDKRSATEDGNSKGNFRTDTE
jgi:Na+-transporting NADH:ubiquinone oxidoreductase subunit NqrC